jgi:hypothetical protein
MNDLRRKGTKERKRLAVITAINAGQASNARRQRHKASFSESILDYYYDPGSATAPCSPLLAMTNRAAPRADEWWKHQPLPLPPKVPDQVQNQPIARSNTEASSPHLSVARSTVLLLDRSLFADYDDTPDDDDEGEGILRRRPHIRRHHRRAISEAALSSDLLPDEHEHEHEPLTPLLDSLAKLYADVPRRQRSYTLRSADSEERNESPSSGSHEGSLRGEEPLLKAFVDGRVATLHDWDNGVHYRDAKVYGVPEGRLLPKRAPTKEVKALLQARRKRAGLSIDLKQDSVDDF